MKLTRNKNGKIRGALETKVWRKNTLESTKSKDLTFRNKLSKIEAKNLFYKLKSAGIDSLFNSRNENKNEALAFLDTDYLIIGIQNNKKTQSKEFPEIYPISQTSGKIEENKLRKKAQKIVTLIDEEIHLKTQFSTDKETKRRSLLLFPRDQHTVY